MKFSANIWNALVARTSWARYLFVLRKAYLTKFWLTHFSQWGEDTVIDKFLRLKSTDAFFVDVGCFHPRKYNNTYLLYKHGWRGINVDLEEIKIQVFRQLRPDDENLCCAVGPVPGVANFQQFGAYSLINSMDPAFIERCKRSGAVSEERSIQVRTLTDILECSRFRSRRFGLLTVDVEGFEAAVLASLDYARFRPNLIMVEIHVNTLRALQETPTYRFLTQEQGYEMVSWTGITVFFMDAALTEKIPV